MTGPTAIPGDQLRVGDVYLPKVGRRMHVESIILRHRPEHPDSPMFIAHGPTDIGTHIAQDWTETYYGDDWVVVERCNTCGLTVCTGCDHTCEVES